MTFEERPGLSSPVNITFYGTESGSLSKTTKWRRLAMTTERWDAKWGIIPWKPFGELRGMERWFEDVFRELSLPATRSRFPIARQTWAPAIEVFEKEDKFTVEAEIPGVKEEDIDISIVGGTLTIKGQRKTESEVKKEGYYCCERYYGSFFRSIALPPNVISKHIEASYDDGILEISLPKAAEVKPSKIPVSVKKKRLNPSLIFPPFTKC